MVSILYIGVERKKRVRKMGYALFTARKLSLTARVNSLNARLMAVSNQQMALADQIYAAQSSNNLQNAYAQKDAISTFSAAIAGGTDYSVAFADYQTSLSDINLSSTESNMSIAALKSQENALDMERETLQTQLNAASQELENVKKAEEQAIKNATVKYVG